MRTKTRTLSAGPALLASAFLGACVFLGASGASAAVQYMDDGAEQNASGGWDLPKSTAGAGNLGQGSCSPDASLLTRPECLALRLVAGTSGDCTAAGGAWTTSSVCNDTETDEASCEAQVGRLWNVGTSKCAVTMKGYNRNKAVCQNLGGVWGAVSPGTCTGNWVLPNASTYTPPLLNRTGNNPGTGDQCLRCHNSVTEWNVNRVRDVDSFLKTGHKNMGRKVVPGSGLPWSGPDGTPYVAADTGVPFDWATGTLGGVQVGWIYGDWLAPLPRAVTLDGVAGGTYSCGRCHMTGWVNSADPTMEPRASFPSIDSDVTVTGSWDVWGISCTRCHGSVVEKSGGSCSVANLFDATTCAAGGGTWTVGGALPTPLGRTSHDGRVTTYDVANGGYCSDLTLSNTFKLMCEWFGATWYSACTDDRWYSAQQCMSAFGCINPDTSHGLNYSTQAACTAGTAGECSNPNYTTSAPCTAVGATWTPATAAWWVAKIPATWSSSSCSVGGGTCTAPQFTTNPDCTNAGGTLSGSTCTLTGATDPDSCELAFGLWNPTRSNLFECMDAGGHWTGNKTRRGQLITSLCAQCHRQESGGNPYDATDPAGKLKVGPAHGTVAFVSHPHTNQFLNSPHGQFTGTFAEIGTASYGAGYGSFFQFEAEAANTGNGCTGCHNVHKSVVKEAGQQGAIREECTECHGKNLAAMAHPQGMGTPLEHMDTDPMEACVTCHMPGGEHLFRINTDATYSTFPAGALAGTVNANTAADGSYAKAVWVDMDQACGQCHGGGTAQAFTTGDVTNASKVVTVGSTTGFVAGGRVVIAAAGALGADGVTRDDLETYVATVDSGTQLSLVAAVSTTLAGTSVEQNPTKSGGAYMTKAQLATLAKGIHADAPVVSFGYALGRPNTLTVNVDGSASSCGGAACDAYDWNWGDGTAHGSGATASHTYATAGSKTITLTVEQYGVNSGSLSKTATVYAPDMPPTVAGTCSFNANTWTETVTDTSSDDKNGGLPKQVTVNWGNGSMLSSDTTAPFGPFTRTYSNAGTYTITHKAIDTIGQSSTKTCTTSPAYFLISGTVKNAAGTANLGSAVVTVKKAGVTVKTVYTASNGTFSAGTLKPGAYTLTVTKSGYTFTVPALSVSIGPSSAGNVINAN